jgi:hypothetical protein
MIPCEQCISKAICLNKTYIKKCHKIITWFLAKKEVQYLGRRYYSSMYLYTVKNTDLRLSSDSITIEFFRFIEAGNSSHTVAIELKEVLKEIEYDTMPNLYN